MNNPKINTKVESHAKQQPGTSSQEMSTSKGNIATFIDSWQNFDRAGSCLVSSICKDLTGTQLGIQEDVLRSCLSTMFSGSVSEQVLGYLKEIENLLASVQAQEKTWGDNKGKAQSQVSCYCLC